MKPFSPSLALLFLVLSTFVMGSAMAGVDDYPTAIAGCYHTDHPGGSPVGVAFTGDLKGSVQDSLIDPWSLYNRECTSFCGWRLRSRNGFEISKAYGDANAWGSHARSDGYTVDMTPAIGAIAWWSSDHVAWVEAVSTNGLSVTIEEYNVDYTGHYNERTISAGSVSGYIHFKDIQSTSDTDIWVDATHGSGGNGSQGNPYNSVLAAVNRASATQPVTIHIKPGTYHESMTIHKNIHLVTWSSGTVRIGG